MKTQQTQQLRERAARAKAKRASDFGLNDSKYQFPDSPELAAGRYVKNNPDKFYESEDYPGYYCDLDGHIYHMSTYGKVYELKQICMTNQSGYGYPVINVYKNKTPHTMTVHSFIMRTLFGETPEGYEIDHIDHNHCNNALSNLTYETIKKNRGHGLCKGLKFKTREV